MDSYRIILNMEVGYRLEVIKPNGFVRDTYDINQEELKDNMIDLCKLLEPDRWEELLGWLRTCYSIGNIKSMKFKLKGDT